MSVPGLAVRLAAAEAVAALTHRRTALDEALGKALARHSDLADRDRAQVRLIAATALRRAGEIAFVLEKLLKRPLPDKAARISAVLSTGAAQLLFLETPPHAAIDLAVRAARESKPDGERYAGLVNAVLRRVAGEGRALLAGEDEARLDTPAWLLDRWTRTYGREEAHAIARQHLASPPLDLSVKSDPDAWAERLGGKRLGSHTVRLPAGAGRIEALSGYADGAWWVQDAAAALPARLLGEVRGKRVADLCAAPGGKTAQLAAAGAEVTAVDSAAPRVKRLEENLARLGLRADVILADASSWRPPAPFDAVLLDAPCLSTGTIRRHPDVQHLKREADLAQLTALQRRLMDAAWAMLRPGGVLVYCTCSLEPEEGPGQVEAFLGRHADAGLDPVDPTELGGDARLVRDGLLRTLPSLTPIGGEDGGGMDGFFAARIEKSA